MKADTSLAPRVDVAEVEYFNLEALRPEVVEKKSFFAFYIALGLFVVVFFHVLLTIQAPLIGDEAYYWLWAKHLALGYHDHPPLVGWMIAASTFFSDLSPLVRLPALICSFLSAVFFYLFAKEILGNTKKGLLALLFFIYTPILAISSLAVFPDTTLMLSWIICLWAGWKSLQDGRYWLLTGMAVGLTLLSKLIGLFLLPSFFLFFVLNREARKWLRKRIFWGGVGLALLVSLPLWIWNWEHGFENFVFQAHDHLAVHPPYPLLSFFAYLGVQILNVSPILFLALVLSTFFLLKGSLKGDVSSQYLISFALPIHLSFAFLSFSTRVGFHWAGIGYISLLVGCIKLNQLKRWLAPSLGVSIAMTVLFFFVLSYPQATAHLLTPLDQRHPTLGIASFLRGKGYGEILGYKTLSEKVENEIKKMEGADSFFLFTDSYTLSSALAFYTQRKTYTFLPTGQGGEYARWQSFEEVQGENGIWVSFSPLSESPEEAQMLKRAFKEVGESVPVQIKDGPVVRSFYVTKLSGLKYPDLLYSVNSDVPRR